MLNDCKKCRTFGEINNYIEFYGKNSRRKSTSTDKQTAT